MTLEAGTRAWCMVDTKKSLMERLFVAHSNALEAFFRRNVRLRSEAPDLAQEVYVRMMRLRSTEAIRNPEGYLFAVASNLAREHGALRGRQGVSIDAEDATLQGQLAELPCFEAELDKERRVLRLREVLTQLPPKAQAALLLQYVHGLTYKEIGQRLGISPRTVNKYLAQGLALCRQRMRRLR